MVTYRRSRTLNWSPYEGHPWQRSFHQAAVEAAVGPVAAADLADHLLLVGDLLVAEVQLAVVLSELQIPRDVLDRGDEGPVLELLLEGPVLELYPHLKTEIHQ